MLQEIDSNLFRIEIPLPDSPLKYLNSYVVRSTEKNLIIDTGLNHPECLTAMKQGLSEIGVDLEKSDIFITHLHADHFSLVSKLATPNTRIYFNRPDAEIVESYRGIDSILPFAARHGFPERKLAATLEAHPAVKFGSNWVPPLQLIENGHQLVYGNYAFTCIETPGHTPGHNCLYEPGKKILVSGDHILCDITPNIQCWSDQGNPLGDYLESLTHVFELDVAIVLPGHRRLIENHRRRIDELIAHHHRRLDEVMRILRRESPISAFETASKMSWDIRADSWEKFPLAQQWFATGEAISHLRYLTTEGRIERIPRDGVDLYTAV